MAKKKLWMKEAFSGATGQLRKSTGTKAGKNISAAALEKAAHSKNPKTRKRANLAKTARKINKKK